MCIRDSGRSFENFLLFIVSKGLAIIKFGSVIANPIFFDPRSIPNQRLFLGFSVAKATSLSMVIIMLSVLLLPLVEVSDSLGIY